MTLSLAGLRVHAGEGLVELVGAGFGHGFAEGEGALLFAVRQLCEDGVDEIGDGREFGVDACAAEVGVEGGRDDFDDFYVPRFQEMPEGEGEGVEEGLGCGIDGDFG